MSQPAVIAKLEHLLQESGELARRLVERGPSFEVMIEAWSGHTREVAFGGGGPAAMLADEVEELAADVLGGEALKIVHRGGPHVREGPNHAADRPVPDVVGLLFGADAGIVPQHPPGERTEAGVDPLKDRRGRGVADLPTVEEGLDFRSLAHSRRSSSRRGVFIGSSGRRNSWRILTVALPVREHRSIFSTRRLPHRAISDAYTCDNLAPSCPSSTGRSCCKTHKLEVAVNRTSTGRMTHMFAGLLIAAAGCGGREAGAGAASAAPPIAEATPSKTTLGLIDGLRDVQDGALVVVEEYPAEMKSPAERLGVTPAAIEHEVIGRLRTAGLKVWTAAEGKPVAPGTPIIGLRASVLPAGNTGVVFFTISLSVRQFAVISSRNVKGSVTTWQSGQFSGSDRAGPNFATLMTEGVASITDQFLTDYRTVVATAH
jgi:hypothetical protein